jgi:hypothetical protein
MHVWTVWMPAPSPAPGSRGASARSGRSQKMKIRFVSLGLGSYSACSAARPGMRELLNTATKQLLCATDAGKQTAALCMAGAWSAAAWFSDAMQAMGRRKPNTP